LLPPISLSLFYFVFQSEIWQFIFFILLSLSPLPTLSLLQVQTVPFFKRRLSAIHGKLLFSGFASQALQTLEKTSTAMLELSTSRGFKRLLSLVLLIGNRLNKGTNRGQAQGFDLRVLTKLSLVKSADRKTSLLRFIAAYIDEHGVGGVLSSNIGEGGTSNQLPSKSWFEEVASIAQATTVSFDNTTKVMTLTLIIYLFIYLEVGRAYFHHPLSFIFLR
jgi:hypothetical protein